MKPIRWVVVLFAALLALSAGTVWAQGTVDDETCFGRSSMVLRAGQQVRNLLVIGCNATVSDGATVRGDVTVFGANVTIEKGARIAQDIAVVGGNVVIGGEVGNSISILGGAVTLLDGAVVNGDVRVAGGSVRRADGAVVRGKINEELGPNTRFPWPFSGSVTPLNPTRPFRLEMDFARDFAGVVALAALGVLVAALAPVGLQRVAGAAQSALPLSAGVGCLTILFIPVVLLALVITLVGIPIAFLVAMAAAAGWYFGWIAIGYLVGLRLLEALRAGAIAPMLATLFGVVVLAVVGQVPCVGWAIGLLTGTLGLGAVLLTRFGTRPYPPPVAFGAVLPPPATPSATADSPPAAQA